LHVRGKCWALTAPVSDWILNMNFCCCCRKIKVYGATGGQEFGTWYSPQDFV
jgi:hypothetical protein